MVLWLMIVMLGISSLSADNHSPSNEFIFSADLKLSTEEKRVDSCLNGMRKELLSRKGKNWTFFNSFIRCRQEIQQEKLYQIFKMMPKGGLLHIHELAIGDVQWILDRAFSIPECWIYWDEDSDSTALGQLAFFLNQPIPPGWFSIRELSLLNPELRKELYRLYTIGPEDEEQPNLRAELVRIEQRIERFISYRPVFIDYFQSGLEALAMDGIQLVELRTTLDPVLNEDGSYIRDESIVKLYQTIAANVNQSFPLFDFRLIVCAERKSSLEEVRRQVEKSNHLKSLFPEMIVGFDLIGNEDHEPRTIFFTPALEMGRIPFFLHGGETGAADNNNVRDALVFNAHRISHALNLYYFPGLEKRLIQYQTLLELCPVSNLALHYVRDLRFHPASGYLQRGVQATLGSDYPAFFQSRGLTDDYFVVYLAWGLDLRSLKKLMENSITNSGLPWSYRNHHLRLFRQNWMDFIHLINQLSSK